MVKKKHCDKHYRFVANCSECQALNAEAEDDSDRKRLYDDVNIEDFNYEDFSNSKNDTPPRRPEIPNIENGPSYHDEPARPNRFTYTRSNSPNFKKKLYIVGIIAVVIILISIFYIYPVWHAKINLQNQLYDTKSGLNYWEIFTLNGWSTNFFFNKIGLIGAILGSLIMSIPPDDSLITIVGQKFGWGKPSKVKTLIIWWTIGFVFFFIIGQAMGSGYFDLVMKMIDEGTIEGNLGSFLTALNAISNPASVSQLDIFLYAAVTLPILRFVLGVIIFRLISTIVYYAYLVKDEFQIAANASFIIAIFFILSLIDRPLQAQNGIDLTQVWSIYLGIFSFLGLGIAFLVYGRKQNQLKIHQFSRNIQKKTIMAAVLTIFIILIPVFISIPKTIGLSTPETWTEEVWDIKDGKQIEWTRAAAGITIGDNDLFMTYSIDNYPQNVIEEDNTILDVIRQHDKINSAKKIKPLITNSFQTMADSDIVFVQGKGEFWVAPKTLQTKKLLESNVNQHTEIYDHVEGFIALDTSTGKILQDSQDYQDIFGVGNDHPIFFGEKEEDTSYLEGTTNTDFYSVPLSIDAYDNDILLNTGWESNESMKYKYEGDPDGTITGLEALWFTANMGLTKNAFDGEDKSFLINRNIRTRVESILMPGLKIDDDPYLVFDRNNSKMFYAVSIYTEIFMGAYTDSFLHRFLGTVLINVQTGELSWYRNPGLPAGSEDPLSSIWGVYMSTYQFEVAEDWLLDQLRYPESLWEKQLVIDYKYHVTNKETWKLKSDFYKRPENGDVFYIETDLGEGLEFVGVDIVEYDQVDSVKLAGLYIIRQGNHFGETIFYKTQSSNNIIGPTTAMGELGNQATNEIFTIQNERYGNILLYPLASSLYYYIPVYSQDGNLESLSLAGLVNAFTQDAYYGPTLTEAYNELKIDLQLNDTTTETNITGLMLEVGEYDEFQYSPTSWAEIRTYFEYFTTNDSLPQKNLMLNLSVRTDVDIDVKVFNSIKPGYQYNFTENIVAWNHTLGVWNDTTAIYPGEGRMITLKLNPSEPLNGPSLSIYIKFDLIDLDSGDIISNGWNILTFVNPD
ncbi:UPF0182 family protein [Candidatus Lokiarchaeum ossiferum]|uniref:UPF0182 family protein n=1 Tax=Candidatus Lokiarchaeum ossiferum TaxID=2951803 RepID=UPI00352DF629